jgi:hypothetical protein
MLVSGPCSRAIATATLTYPKDLIRRSFLDRDHPPGWRSGPGTGEVG